MPAVASKRQAGAAVLAPSKLQQQLDALYSVAPRLCPVVKPKGMDDQGLLELAKREPAGDQSVQQLKAVLDTAARTCTCCAYCGQTGEAAGSAPVPNADDDIDPATLLFATDWRLDFNTKAMRLHKGQFACGLCRACMDLSGFIALAASSDYGEMAEGKTELMKAMCSHIVEVNSPEGIDSGNVVACTAWAQEVYALAYSLQVIASNVRGWRIQDCEGSAFDYRSQSGVTAAVAKKCLSSIDVKQAKKKKKKTTLEQEDTPAGLVTPTPSKKKKKPVQGASKTPAPLKHRTATLEKKKKRRGSL